MPIIVDPGKIEQKSFELIEDFLKNKKIPLYEKEVVKRVIHATADLKYASDLLFHPEAIECALSAIKNGSGIIVDSSMVEAGINKERVSAFKSRLICFIKDPGVIRKSCQLKVSRAILAMRKASKFMHNSIIAIGNAPTALFEVCNLVERGDVTPAVIIGVPVGFVGAKEAKKKLRSLGIPYITNRTRKGGSSVACAIINSLLILAKEREILFPLSRM